MEAKQYFIVYKITNKINSKYYIGAHKTFDLRDGYMGSGTIMKRAHIKYGLNNFSKEILGFRDTEKEMYLYEAELVTQEIVDDINSYNMVLGGRGATSQLDSTGHRNVTDGKGNNFRVEKDDPRILSGELKSNTLGRISITNGVRNKFVYPDNPIPKGWEIGLVKSSNKAQFAHLIGLEPVVPNVIKEKNHDTAIQYFKDTKTITNGIQNKRIFKNSDIPEGWWSGNTHKKMCITNGVMNFSIYRDEPIPEGWKRGRFQKPLINRINITDGVKVKKIVPTELIPEGWWEGTTNKNKHNITNGTEYKLHNRDEPIPEGWHVKGTTTNRISITNGTQTRYIHQEESIPDGWIRGSTSVGPKGKLLYTNGTTNLFLYKNEHIPEGFVRGRKPKENPIKKVLINNGIQTKGINEKDPIPEGWVLGKLALSPNKSKKCYTDGKTNVYLTDDQDVPQGWYRGNNLKGRKIE